LIGWYYSTQCGEGSLSSDEYERQILPHKLSLKMPRRKCLVMNETACTDIRPPMADFPRYSSTASSYSDLMNYDIKIPGEHTLEGESFDAEIQMLHVHPGSVPRMGSIGIPVRAVGDEGYNSEFQNVVNQFQLLYDSHVATCGRRQLRQQQKQQKADAATAKKSMLRKLVEWLVPSPAEVAELDEEEEDDARELQTSRPNKFDPYQEALMPTMWFYRYDGSITEPPCKDITWWVMMEPMIISVRQLDQLKLILFSNVDPNDNCRKTSVHNRDQSVARPLYDLGSDREIQKCEEGYFTSDISKGRPEGNQCFF
jgi:carbonic anhydrase